MKKTKDVKPRASSAGQASEGALVSGVETPIPHVITVAEKYCPAMKITDEAEAHRYFERCVSHCMSFGNSRAEAESIERRSLAYFAGYYDSETRERVERLFRCAHPIFGAIAQNGPPSPEEAFAAGLERARTPPPPVAGRKQSDRKRKADAHK